MGKKLPSLGPNILKHLQKNVGPYKGRWIYALSWIFIAPWEPFSLLCSFAYTQCKPGLKSFATIWSCLNPGKKKLGFFQKWLYRVEKTNMSVRCRSHKTSECFAAISTQRKFPILPTDSIWNTINVKVHCKTDTSVCRHRAHTWGQKT